MRVARGIQTLFNSVSFNRPETLMRMKFAEFRAADLEENGNERVKRATVMRKHEDWRRV